MKNKIFQYLEKTKYGYLKINTPCANCIDVGDENSNLHADINIKDWQVMELVLAKGDIGFGEAYIEGLFTTTDIAKLLRFFAANQELLDPLFHSNIIYNIFFKIKNLCKKNSIKGSKKNISYHYDLGNDFYRLWLDETMSYSSGIFCTDNSLIKSQTNKYQRILDKLNKNGSDILEIGCGWGGFINAAHHAGYNTTGLTLSTEQKLYSDNIIKAHQLNATTKLQDYRHETSKFSNIVSIEMFEAVGKKYWDHYFAKIKEILKKDGKAVIQTIAINDKFYQKYQNTSDYIREYIFPGGFLPSLTIFKNLAKKHRLHILDQFHFSDSYNKTLLYWLDNFNKSREKIINLGYNAEFIRKWQFYLAYCAAGFASNRTDVIQYTMTHD